jgi:hypothetical protein
MGGPATDDELSGLGDELLTDDDLGEEGGGLSDDDLDEG